LATLARLLLAQEKPELALEMLGSLRPAVEGKQLTAMVIDALVLQALALQAREEMPYALDRLNQALSLAQPEGYVRTFVNEGEAMQALLHRVTGKNRRYAAALMGVFEAHSHQRGLEKNRTGVVEIPGGILIEPLSRRELELVPLLAEGLSNQEIARKLHISLGTVKIHLKHIYGKLEVSSRTQAVARARELGLLAEQET
jgi:LuxR family maltose regulon positive regulatory protein